MCHTRNLLLSTVISSLLLLVHGLWPTDPETTQCQAKMDEFCKTHCYNNISGRPCDGPMRARRAWGGKGLDWRCYSPSTLRYDNATYSHGDCYCTRPDLQDIATECMPQHCKTMQDNFCNQECLPRIEHKGCQGPMRAIQTAKDGKKCFSPGSYDQKSGKITNSCYCSRDTDLWDIAADCMKGLVTSRPFVDGVPGNVCYRIPAIVMTPTGTLVAFAEARHGGCHDSQVKEIATTRSTDGGRTWSAIKWAAVPRTSKGNVGNPMPFALHDGTVALAFVYRNNGGSAHGSGNGIVFSHDDGWTWSAMHDISSGMGSVPGTMPGPGAGLVLEDGTLVLPSHDGFGKYDYVSLSHDGGKTWKTARGPPTEHVTEPAIANLGNGNLIMNMRTGKEKSEGKGVSRSADGGLTWSDVTYDSALKGPVCQASMAKIGDVLYFANPDNTSHRSHLTVKRSFNDGHSWDSNVYEIQYHTAQGYSSLVQGEVEPNYGGILYESDSTPIGGSIDFKTFPLDF